MNVILLQRFFDVVKEPDTPIAQGIEHRPPEAGAAVRIRLGVLTDTRR